MKNRTASGVAIALSALGLLLASSASANSRATQSDLYLLTAQTSERLELHPAVSPERFSYAENVCGGLLLVELSERADQSEVEGLALDEGLRPALGRITVLQRLGFEERKALLIHVQRLPSSTATKAQLSRREARLTHDLRQLAVDLGQRILYRSTCHVVTR